jgi:hypothetical protein
MSCRLASAGGGDEAAGEDDDDEHAAAAMTERPAPRLEIATQPVDNLRTDDLALENMAQDWCFATVPASRLMCAVSFRSSPVTLGTSRATGTLKHGFQARRTSIRPRGTVNVSPPASIHQPAPRLARAHILAAGALVALLGLGPAVLWDMTSQPPAPPSFSPWPKPSPWKTAGQQMKDGAKAVALVYLPPGPVDPMQDEGPPGTTALAVPTVSPTGSTAMGIMPHLPKTAAFGPAPLPVPTVVRPLARRAFADVDF